MPGTEKENPPKVKVCAMEFGSFGGVGIGLIGP